MIECALKVDRAFEMAGAAQIVQTASRFKSHVSLVSEEKTANAKSIMGIFSLELHGGSTVKIVADGEDENQVVPELANILSFSNDD
ncbi:MAG: HPr family phosphocarrier protein [Defluviitaleaceae bacterium]|nr:HPr family phosphocarrier protein [Defluviitaleaceae bacterium]MCL2264270.1 HPr family phosphocarrier protein [Defluviitaleaceae bacterium]